MSKESRFESPYEEAVRETLEEARDVLKEATGWNDAALEGVLKRIQERMNAKQK